MINDGNDASYASFGMSKCRSGLYREEFFFFLFYSFLAKVIHNLDGKSFVMEEYSYYIGVDENCW